MAGKRSFVNGIVFCSILIIGLLNQTGNYCIISTFFLVCLLLVIKIVLLVKIKSFFKMQIMLNLFLHKIYVHVIMTHGNNIIKLQHIIL